MRTIVTRVLATVGVMLWPLLGAVVVAWVVTRVVAWGILSRAVVRTVVGCPTAWVMHSAWWAWTLTVLGHLKGVG